MLEEQELQVVHCYHIANFPVAAADLAQCRLLQVSKRAGCAGERIQFYQTVDARSVADSGCRVVHRALDHGVHFAVGRVGNAFKTAVGAAFAKYRVELLVLGFRREWRVPLYHFVVGVHFVNA